MGPDGSANHPATKTGTGFERLLTPKEAADFLRVSLSWLAKARMRGDGPPYVKLGRSIRYTEGALLQWMSSPASVDERAVVVEKPRKFWTTSSPFPGFH